LIQVTLSTDIYCDKLKEILDLKIFGPLNKHAVAGHWLLFAHPCFNQTELCVAACRSHHHCSCSIWFTLFVKQLVHIRTYDI